MANHQTVRLGRGSHRSPDRGVCVMELASMLAGERFTDKPRSVSPVIAGFLRTYNDLLDDDGRQALYGYAARVVGTDAPREVEHGRGSRCVDWARERGVRVPLMLRLRPATPAAGALAATCAGSAQGGAEHLRALALVDELISFGDSWVAVPADPGELLALAAEHGDAEAPTTTRGG